MSRKGLSLRRSEGGQVVSQVGAWGRVFSQKGQQVQRPELGAFLRVIIE